MILTVLISINIVNIVFVRIGITIYSNAFMVFPAVLGFRDFNQGAYFSSRKNCNVENLEYLLKWEPRIQ